VAHLSFIDDYPTLILGRMREPAASPTLMSQSRARSYICARTTRRRRTLAPAPNRPWPGASQAHCAHHGVGVHLQLDTLKNRYLRSRGSLVQA
jgi:hypothetical protein